MKCASLFGVALELYGGVAQPSGDARPRGPAPEPADRLTARQLAAIQTVCRRRSLGREEFQALLAKKTGKSALQFLTRAEASSVLDELDSRGANGTSAH